MCRLSRPFEPIVRLQVEVRVEGRSNGSIDDSAGDAVTISRRGITGIYRIEPHMMTLCDDHGGEFDLRYRVQAFSRRHSTESLSDPRQLLVPDLRVLAFAHTVAVI